VNEEEGITEGKEGANRKGRGKATILVKDLLFSHPSDGPPILWHGGQRGRFLELATK
jgi:hypothetical protein